MSKKEIDDRFKKFGTVSFIGQSKVNDFIDYLEAGKIMGTRCRDCGIMFFPPRADCYKCLTSNMDWFEVDKPGQLVSFSKLQFGPVGFENDLPYIIALLDFGEFKIFGRIADQVPENELSIGMQMKAMVNKLPNGQLNYVFDRQ
ncbi:MAG: Zn-ribbon domain-containing OB-fold protein [Desulfovermiculus sp.]|nr:Zn-ribbon domain-containing OB-fold protein [Desulfovermiculus sp.]